ncbi:MAG: diguanylate cyclase [Oscillochloris sp.]|nr:diguanylate cyclase [Oscillochloris sp.]
MTSLELYADQNVRIDQLTGIGNLLAFADALLTNIDRTAPRSFITLDLNGIKRLEREQGDQALRWMALVLREELPVPVFRIGADDFAAILPGADHIRHRQMADRLAARLNHDAGRIGLQTPVVALAVIHYQGSEPATPADVLGELQAAVQAARAQGAIQALAVQAGNAETAVDMRALSNRLVGRLVELGVVLEQSQHLAASDPVTGMPNLRAALQQIDRTFRSAVDTGRLFSILMVDGDNLRRYNEVGYAAGDRMLIDLAAVLREQLRPHDFLARWRVGDEFLILLPETGVSGAATLAERLRRKVEETSQFWPFPVTISIGIATYPQHGHSSEALVHHAEQANRHAKASGRNRIVIAAISMPQ